MSGSEAKQVMKVCQKCGHTETLPGWFWAMCPTARHSGAGEACGGHYRSTVTKIGGERSS